MVWYPIRIADAVVSLKAFSREYVQTQVRNVDDVLEEYVVIADRESDCPYSS